MATNAQYLDAKILDLQRQLNMWKSERGRKKMLYQRLQDEYEADVRRSLLMKKVQDQLHKKVCYQHVDVKLNDICNVQRV